MIAAYVEGLPIPSASSFLTREDSVNLEGGLVKSSLIRSFSNLRISPSFIVGNSPRGRSYSSLNIL